MAFWRKGVAGGLSALGGNAMGGEGATREERLLEKSVAGRRRRRWKGSAVGGNRVARGSASGQRRRGELSAVGEKASRRRSILGKGAAG